MEWIVVGVLVVLTSAALRYLPPFHPAQLWSGPWLIVCTFYAIGLLPYNPLRTETAAVIAVAALAFCVAAWVAGGCRRARAVGVGDDAFERARITARVLLFVAGVWLLAFLFQAMSAYGLRSALVPSADVRQAIQAGEFVLTIKFVYVSLAAAMACALAAATSPDGRARRRWLLTALLPVGAMYFSTGRANFVTALMMASLVYLVARPVVPRARQVALACIAAAAVFVATLTVGGNLIGKTFQASELATFESTFTEHPAFEPLALPYQYATAPIAALNELVPSVGTHGATAGCATVALACTVGERVGVTGEPLPAIRVFTAEPLSWNTYTALDAPLMDAGPLGGLLIVAGLGLFAGVAWRGARNGKPTFIALYGAVGTATISSVIQNNFFAFHYVGAILIFCLAWLAAARLSSRNHGHPSADTTLASRLRAIPGTLPGRLGL